MSGPLEGVRVTVAVWDDRIDVFIRPDLTPRDAAADLRQVADRLERGGDDDLAHAPRDRT